MLTTLFAIKLSNEGTQILLNHNIQQYLKSTHQCLEEYSNENLPKLLDNGYRMMTLRDIMHIFGPHVHDNVIQDLR